MIDYFTIYARPSLKAVNKKLLFLLSPLLSSTVNLDFIIKGGTFFNLSNVYLSSNDENMFSGVTFYNPFSAVKNLSAQYIGFSAVLLPEFSYNENYVFFTLPEMPKASGFFDVIVENEAGYGKLTTSPYVSSGIQVIKYYLS